MLRRIIYFVLVTVVLGGIGGLIAFYAFDFKPKFLAQVILSMPPPVQTVSAEPARTDKWEPFIAAIGSLTAVNGIEIAPQVGGVVREINFDSGDVVKKGQKLIQLDTDTDQADLRNLQVQLQNAETEYGRTQKIFDKGFAAQAALDTATALRDQLKANVQRTEALIAQKTLYAPWDGKLGLRDVAVGKYVAPGQAVIWMQTVDPIYADFTVSEADFGRIKIGQKITARFTAYPNDMFNGEIATTDAKMSETSRMITVRARIPNPDSRLVPGMYADVRVIAGDAENVVTVPQTAVTYSLYGDSVFAAVPDKDKPDEFQIERRFVKVGTVREGRVQVLDGVKTGDQVVTAGQNKIDQGSKVKIDNSIALNLNVDRMSQ
ncbi:efflux RND transporter periplasmic adaptor subunit [soil metagenome]